MNSEQLYSKFFGDRVFSRNAARDRKTLIERMYQRIFIELCTNRFKWKGLPPTIDERYLEMTLFHKALCVFYYDNDVDRYLALNAAAVGPVNMYDNPTSFRVVGNTMINKELKGNECVPIWANYMRVPDLDIVMVYANKLAEIDRTIEINTINMRNTRIVIAGQNNQLTMANADRQFAEGQAALYVKKGGAFDKDDITSIDIGLDSKTIPDLLLAREKMWANAMTLLGINNSNQDKKERLVSGETEANNDQIEHMKAVSLNARKQACVRINEMYPGLTVSVDFGGMEAELPAFGDLGEYVLDEDVSENDSQKEITNG